MIGQTLGGYQIIEQIGQGGMATVFKAYDAGTDRFVALKLLPESHTNNQQFRDRFQREARAIARLEHTHILPIFAYGEENDRAYLVMRYLSSGSLADHMANGSLTDDEIVRVIGQIASALDYAHQHQVIHRDVKPANVLLDANHNAFLTDFGIAKLVEATTQLTGQGLIGTPSYMSPEQCEGTKPITAASDQYSLAVMLYEMVTGAKPYTGDTPIAVIMQHITAVQPDARALRPDLPEAAAQIIEIALSKSPTDRFATCSEFAAAFSDAMHGRAITSLHPAPPPAATLAWSPRDNASSSEPTRLAKPARKTPIWVFGVIGLIAMGVLIGAFLLLRPKGADTAEASPTAATAAPDDATQAVDASGETPDAVVPAQPTATLSPIDLAEYLTRCDGDLCINGGGHSPIALGLSGDLQVPGSGQEFSWSPDGQQIVFSGEVEVTFKNIYIMNRDGSDLHLLRANADWPAWSPDGNWISFNFEGSIAAIHADGSDEMIISSGVEGTDQWSTWSADGQWIAWINGENHEGANVANAIWVKNVADEGQPYPVYSDTTVGLNRVPPAWSPDGRSIVFRLESGAPRSVSALCDTRTETCPVTTLDDFPDHWRHIYFPQWAGETSLAAPIPTATPFPASLAEYLVNCAGDVCIYGGDHAPIQLGLGDDYVISNDREFSWSYDGQQFAFAVEKERSAPDIYLANRDGSNVRLLKSNADMPAWQPGGDLIVFHYGGEIRTIFSDSSGEKTIMVRVGNLIEHFPVWSPSGQQFAWAEGINYDVYHGVWVADADGNGRHLVFNDATKDIDPHNMAWTPDGESIVFQLTNGEFLQVSASCDVNLEVCEAKTVSAYPVYWTHQYFPQWAGEIVITPTAASSP